MQASAWESRDLRKSSRLMKFSCDGSIVSADTSYGLPRIVALAPRTSPGSAILTISVFPPVEDTVSFARPLQRIRRLADLHLPRRATILSDRGP
jgi:hypothetical protein